MAEQVYTNLRLVDGRVRRRGSMLPLGVKKGNALSGSHRLGGGESVYGQHLPHCSSVVSLLVHTVAGPA